MPWASFGLEAMVCQPPGDFDGLDLWASVISYAYKGAVGRTNRYRQVQVQAQREALTTPQLKMSTRLVSCPTLMNSSGRYAAEAWNRCVFITVYFDLLLSGHRWATG